MKIKVTFINNETEEYIGDYDMCDNHISITHIPVNSNHAWVNTVIPFRNIKHIDIHT